MKINELKELLKKFESNIIYNADLKKKIGLILEEKQRFFLKLMN
jgi:hypothetical protein